jgi:hypothetical protein
MGISELRVPNPSNIIGLFGRAVPREQWRRELLENARHANATTVVFGPWTDPESGLELMRVSDDGCGMNPRVLERRIRELADPERQETFGIGGRISTATISPAGVAWASREQGAPAAMVVMRKERNRWGLQQFPDQDGRIACAVEPVAGMLPRLASEHGTSVVLYGDGRHSTWRPAEASGIAGYLIRRYWTFGQTAVRVHGWTGGGSEGGNVRLPDSQELVERYKESGGIVTLADGSIVRWFRVAGPTRNVTTVGGHRSRLPTGLAVLHGDELYDRADKMRLARFGIYTRTAQARVVLVVVPHPDLHIAPTAERTRLVRPDARDLPWREWESSFVEQLPPELAELLPTSVTLDLEHLAAQFGPDWRERIRPRSRPLGGAGGDDEGAGSAFELAAALDPAPREEQPPTDPDEGEPKPAEGEAEAVERERPKRKPVNVEADGRTRARRGRSHDIPQPKPIAPEQWSYGDHMDYAYIESLNELHYKTTGEAIERQTRYWIDRHDDLDAEQVSETVQTAYAVEMVGKILHVLDVYAGREGWTDPLDEMLAPRTLTLASLGFHAVDAWIEERLGHEHHPLGEQQLGS